MQKRDSYPEPRREVKRVAMEDRREKTMTSDPEYLINILKGHDPRDVGDLGLYAHALSRVGEFRDSPIRHVVALGQTTTGDLAPTNGPEPDKAVLAGITPLGYDSWEHAATDYLRHMVRSAQPGKVTHLDDNSDDRQRSRYEWTQLQEQFDDIEIATLSVDGVDGLFAEDRTTQEQYGTFVSAAKDLLEVSASKFLDIDQAA